ncbi:MAG: hypothetical protein Q9159_001061 [Coniocarpon cinnabarinum]
MEASKLPGSRFTRKPGSAPHHLLLEGPRVKIIVGAITEESIHILPRALLCHYSTYFHNALEGHFREAREGVVHLEDEDPVLFNRVVRWLMTGTIVDHESNTLQDLKDSCSLWMFGDRRSMPALQNSAIDAFREVDLRYWYWDKSIIRYVFENTMPNARLRSFLVENFVNTACGEFFDLGPNSSSETGSGLPHEFWRTALTTFFRVAEQGGRPPDARKWLRQLNTCQFHVSELSSFVQGLAEESCAHEVICRNILMHGWAVTIGVVKNQAAKTYYAHKKLLCHYSGYFDRFFNDENDKLYTSAHRRVHLNDVSPILFGHVFDWLYTGVVNVPDGSTNESKETHQTNLVNLWLLADHLDMPALQNAVLDELHTSVRRDQYVCDYQIKQILFVKSSANSKVRLWVTEIYAIHIGQRDYLTKIVQDSEAPADPDLLKLMIIRMSELSKLQTPLDIFERLLKTDMCQFHEHEDGKNCEILMNQDLSLLHGPVVRLNVGQGSHKKTYFVHKALLTHYSDYFNAMLNNPFFIEGRDTKGYQTVNLDEEEPEVFDRAYHWLYNGSVLTNAEYQDYNFQMMLVELWLLADRRGMPALQNDALDAINRNSNVTKKLCEVVLIHRLWNLSPRRSPVRSWLLEQFVGVKNLEVLFNRPVPAHWNFPPQDFVHALTLRQREVIRHGKREEDKLKKLDICAFHEHRDGKGCRVLAEEDRAMRDARPRSA